ncbi:alpha/beta fold hydrolase [Alteraurantiacibacter aquimixticola]|uniref:Alpha/beta hydrolase n=1 Tax=Alteraurantiacibacter aquimixticola TaxID=2489173 RepID=A0A4T3F1D8_9SPHN|nr:alpha/beta hydrolase [Alteraurantiacibacter aquimixticola]TIX51005.1 alpha/beta hydrolase [Alteraurantiacibacter aquimixticola]
MFERANCGAWLRAPIILLLALALLLGLPFPSTVLAQEVEYDRFSVEIVGEGPDVILIPGLATPRDVWAPQVEQLQDRYRLHLLQVRGFGEPAGANSEGPILDDLVDELAEYIAAEGLEHPALVGHSLGGLISLILAAEHPALPGKLLIVDALPWYAAVFAPGQEIAMAQVEPQAAMMRAQLLAAADAEPDPQAIAANTANQSLSEEGRAKVAAWSAAADQRVTAQLIYEDLTTDMRERIAEITAPVTVLVPFADPYPTEPIAREFYAGEYAALEGVRITPIGPSRHFIMLDVPEAFAEVLEEVLAE